MVRAMCGVKLVERRSIDELMDMLGLHETVDRMARASGVRWYGHVLRREDGNILKDALAFEVSGQRKRG